MPHVIEFGCYCFACGAALAAAFLGAAFLLLDAEPPHHLTDAERRLLSLLARDRAARQVRDIGR